MNNATQRLLINITNKPETMEIRFGLSIACKRITMLSHMFITIAIGKPNFLFNIRPNKSKPPAEQLQFKMIPMPQPRNRPPIITGIGAYTCSTETFNFIKKSRNIGKSKLTAIDFTITSNPNVISPKRSKRTLIIRTNVEIEMEVTLLINRESPVTPAEQYPAGRINNPKAAAVRMVPSKILI